MTKSEQIKLDLDKYKSAIRLNNFSITKELERKYNLYGAPPFIVVQELYDLLADTMLIEHRDSAYFELAKEI